jgi:hypothetical protein
MSVVGASLLEDGESDERVLVSDSAKSVAGTSSLEDRESSEIMSRRPQPSIRQ